MSKTTLIAPTATFSMESAAGNNYTANNLRQISINQGADVIDALKAGCLTYDDPEQGAQLPLATGRFYPPQGTLAAVLTVLGTLYAYPVFIPNQISVQTLNISTTTGQTGGAAHIGIYADNLGYPGALIYDSGAVTGLTATAVNTSTPATPPLLQPGWYWIATIFTASSTMPSVAGISAVYTNPMLGQIGFDTAAHALATSGQAVTGMSVTGQTYGALPNSFPTGATVSLNVTTPAIAIGY